MGVLATKGDYRLYNDGGSSVIPYLITIEKRKMYGDCEVWIKAHDKIFTDFKEATFALMDIIKKEQQV